MDPVPPSTELDQLRACLDAQRNHILEVVGGLDDEQLRLATLPSGWTPRQLVRHLTLGDERYWFSSIIGGADLDWTHTEVDWHVEEREASESIIAEYRAQIVASTAAIDGVSPTDPPLQRDPQWEEWGVSFPSVRHIILHMIVETATHLDAAVELLDGRQRLVLE